MKQKLLFCLFTFFCFSICSFSYGQIVSITTNPGTSGNVVVGGSTYHASESIFLASEIGAGIFETAGTAINTVAVNMNNLSTATLPVSVPGYQIYMKNIPAGTTTLATGTYSLTGYTQVFSGTLNITALGFYNITLTTTFTRTAGSNLQILLIRSSGAAVTGTNFDCSTGNTVAGTAALTTRRYNSTVAPAENSTSLVESNFRFAVQLKHVVPNDLSVERVETLSKIPQLYGFPHTIKALIKNVGTSTIAAGTVVTLNVTGANTYTNTKTTNSLAPDATQLISFDPAVAFLAGTNTVTVSVPADDNTSNNSVATTQLVNGTAFSYADNTAPGSSVGWGTGAGLILNKYTVQGTGFVTGVKIYIGNVAANTGNTVNAVVLNAAGTIVGQSPSYVILATDLGTYKSFAITTPPSVSVAEFYAGLAQTANAVSYSPVGTQNEASPTRTGAYYSAPLAGGVAPTESTTLGRFMIEALISPTTTAVPLTLVSFNGKLENSTAQLSWTTSTEVSTDRFEIERSSNSSTWLSIATVAAKTAANNNYQATDANLTAGKWFYRLKMIDKNGSFTYSRIVTLDLNGKSLFVLNQNYPNPVKGSTQLSYQVSEEAKVMIVLLTNDGKQIATLVNQQQGVGSYNITVDLAKYSLAAGNYIYKMIALDKNNQELFQSTKTITVVQ